jgi:hypothetical protein
MKKGLSQLAETLEGSLRTRSDSAPSHGANESEAPGSSCRNAPGAIRRRRTARMKAKPLAFREKRTRSDSNARPSVP